MTLLDVLLHLLNFVAPALALAVALSLAGRFVSGNASRSVRWYTAVAINFAVGVAVLLGGLWLHGRDGKMSTYAALVLAMATSQWLLGRAWQR